MFIFTYKIIFSRYLINFRKLLDWFIRKRSFKFKIFILSFLLIISHNHLIGWLEVILSFYQRIFWIYKYDVNWKKKSMISIFRIWRQIYICYKNVLKEYMHNIFNFVNVFPFFIEAFEYKFFLEWKFRYFVDIAIQFIRNRKIYIFCVFINFV